MLSGGLRNISQGETLTLPSGSAGAVIKGRYRQAPGTMLTLTIAVLGFQES